MMVIMFGIIQIFKLIISINIGMIVILVMMSLILVF
jgi:hypothetical protein